MLVRSFACLFVCCLVYSCVGLFVRLLVRPFVCWSSFVCLVVRFVLNCPLVCLFVRLFDRFFVCWLVRSFARWFVRLFVRSSGRAVLRLFVRSCV